MSAELLRWQQSAGAPLLKEQQRMAAKLAICGKNRLARGLQSGWLGRHLPNRAND